MLDSILKGVAGQVGGLLWDCAESDQAAADGDDDSGDDPPGLRHDDDVRVIEMLKRLSKHLV